MDETANLPPDGVTTWQFNFKFNLTEDMYAEDSIDLLQNSGIQFDKHERDGIDPVAFAEMMLTSGLVLMEEVKWLSFHSGYDFGYLIHLLTNQVKFIHFPNQKLLSHHQFVLEPSQDRGNIL